MKEKKKQRSKSKKRKSKTQEEINLTKPVNIFPRNIVTAKNIT